MLFISSSTVAAALALFGSAATMVQAQSSGNGLTVTSPTADRWWVAQSINTLAWQTASSSSITQFSVFLANPDVNLLTSSLALISIQPTYEYSKDVNPPFRPGVASGIMADPLSGQMKPGKGYVIQLTDPLNSTNVYASSQSFEIKAVGSSYPAQTSGSSSATASASGSSGSSSSAASASGSAAAAATSRSAANPRAINPLFHGAAAAGYLFDLFVGEENKRFLPSQK